MSWFYTLNHTASSPIKFLSTVDVFFFRVLRYHGQLLIRFRCHLLDTIGGRMQIFSPQHTSMGLLFEFVAQFSMGCMHYYDRQVFAPSCASSHAWASFSHDCFPNLHLLLSLIQLTSVASPSIDRCRPSKEWYYFLAFELISNSFSSHQNQIVALRNSFIEMQKHNPQSTKSFKHFWVNISLNWLYELKLYYNYQK